MPFYITQVKERDRKSCLVDEAKIVFGTCPKFRMELLKSKENQTDNDSLIWKSLTKVSEKTLHPKEENIIYHQIEC